MVVQHEYVRVHSSAKAALLSDAEKFVCTRHEFSFQWKLFMDAAKIRDASKKTHSIVNDRIDPSSRFVLELYN